MPGPTADTVYVAGDFTKINNKGPNHIQLLNVNTGLAVTSFKAPSTNGGIETMELLPEQPPVHRWLLHQDRRRQPRPARHPERHHGRARPLHGHHRVGHTTTPAPARRRRSAPASPALTPAGDRMVVIGNFRTVGGLARDQIVMIDLTGADRRGVDDLVHHAVHADLLTRRVRQLHARRRDVARRIVLRRRHHRWPAQRHAVRHRGPLRDLRRRHRARRRPGPTPPAATPCGASRSPSRPSTSAVTSAG